MAVETSQNEAKAEASYKILYGQFKKRNEAIKESIRAKEKDLRNSIILEGNMYSILFGEHREKEAAEKELEKVKTAGYNAELKNK